MQLLETWTSEMLPAIYTPGKFLCTLDKIPTASSGRSFSIFRGPSPTKQCWIYWVNLDGSASTLCWGWGRAGGEVGGKNICWQKCKVFWQGLYMHELPVAAESHQLMWWNHVCGIIVSCNCNCNCVRILLKDIAKKVPIEVNNFV